MNLGSGALRRTIIAGAVGCAAALGPAVALAATGGHAAPEGPAAAGSRAVTGGRAGMAATPACTTPGLDVWLDTQGQGAAGTMYYDLEFTNLSGSTCTLYGYPGVSGVSMAGGQIGSPASRSGTTPHTVSLANGATATAMVGIVDAGVFPSAQCGPVTAAGLRVYPPNQTQSKVVPFPLPACAKSGELYLHVYPMEP